MIEKQAETPAGRTTHSPLLSYTHTVIADGVTIYQGNDWNEAIRLFLEHGKRQGVRCVEHRIGNLQAAIWGRP